MRREEARRLLAQHVDELQTMGVRSLALFGSVVRDEAGPDSDVDLLVEVPSTMGLFGLFAIQHRLEEILGAKVDLITREGVHPALRDRIFDEAMDVIPAA